LSFKSDKLKKHKKQTYQNFELIYFMCTCTKSVIWEWILLEYVTKNWKENMIIDKTVVAKQLIKICLQQNILIKFGIENKWISALSFNSRQFYPDFSHF
jgi:hypothetical protein